MMMVDETTTPSTTTPSARATVATTASKNTSSPSSRPTPVAHGGSRPRTPAAASAVRDGRTLLAQFRNSKRRDATSSSPHATAVPARHANGSSGPSAAKSTVGKRTTDHVESYASRAPGLARNLEAALDASLASRRNNDDTDGGGSGGAVLEEGKNGVEASYDTPKKAAALNGVPNGHAVGPSDGETRVERDDESSNGGASVSTAAAADITAAAAATAVAAAKPSPPRKGAISRSDESPERSTPEVVRLAALTSQAAFLSSVLPAPDSGFDTSPSASTHQQLSPPIKPGGGGSGTATDDAGSPALPPSDAAGSDKRAVARWASMRRLQEQSAGLGSAADHQLARALQLCRELRWLKNGVGGGNLSGNERASRLDALQSTLHGLEEVLSKRNNVEKAAMVEAGALGGPAVLTNLLQGGSHQTQPDALGDGEVGAATASVTPTKGTAVADAGGWLSGSQLKAFEEKIQARSCIEISALESERRKLRSKVDMFQRQVQLLQRDGATQSPAAANGSSSRIGASPMGEGDTNGFGSAAGEKRFADLLDARLGEERHVQATLEAELNSLRGSLEEKDGLISALREALRSAATPDTRGSAADATADATADAGASRAVAAGSQQPTSPADQQDAVVENNAPAPRSADGRAVVPGRGVFAPLSDQSNRSFGRYHARSSQFMGAQGPVAAAGAAASHAVRGPRGRSWSRSSSVDVSGGTREDELGKSEADSSGATADLAGSSMAGSSSAGGDWAPPSRRDSGDGVVAGRAAAFPSRNGTPAGAKSSIGAVSSGRVGPPGVSRRRDGDGYTDIISQATAVTGTTLKSLWDSAWVVGSRVGLDGAVGSESPRSKPRRRGNSSHAVLIL